MQFPAGWQCGSRLENPLTIVGVGLRLLEWAEEYSYHTGRMGPVPTSDWVCPVCSSWNLARGKAYCSLCSYRGTQYGSYLLGLRFLRRQSRHGPQREGEKIRG